MPWQHLIHFVCKINLLQWRQQEARWRGRWRKIKAKYIVLCSSNALAGNKREENRVNGNSSEIFNLVLYFLNPIMKIYEDWSSVEIDLRDKDSSVVDSFESLTVFLLEIFFRFKDSDACSGWEKVILEARAVVLCCDVSNRRWDASRSISSMAPRTLGTSGYSACRNRAALEVSVPERPAAPNTSSGECSFDHLNGGNTSRW